MWIILRAKKKALSASRLALSMLQKYSTVVLSVIEHIFEYLGCKITYRVSKRLYESTRVMLVRTVMYQAVSRITRVSRG